MPQPHSARQQAAPGGGSRHPARHPARTHNCPLRARFGAAIAIPIGCHRGAAVGNFGAVLWEFPGVARQHSVSGDGVRKRFSENCGIGLFRIGKPGN